MPSTSTVTPNARGSILSASFCLSVEEARSSSTVLVETSPTTSPFSATSAVIPKGGAAGKDDSAVGAFLMSVCSARRCQKHWWHILHITPSRHPAWRLTKRHAGEQLWGCPIEPIDKRGVGSNFDDFAFGVGSAGGGGGVSSSPVSATVNVCATGSLSTTGTGHAPEFAEIFAGTAACVDTKAGEPSNQEDGGDGSVVLKAVVGVLVTSSGGATLRRGLPETSALTSTMGAPSRGSP
mmetsp:Transcript_98124/g.245996  ORF Transcript_98124/g.245996 Transcript_98124/m.245996 type:complete len:237 (+) Transcript_98124:1896-2606(+)